MIYQKIVINNFRGIKNLEIDDLKRINLFVGKNNCGKSSILESIYLLTGISNPFLNVNIDNYRDLIHTNNEDFKFIFHNFELNNNISVEGSFTQEEYRKITFEPNFRDKEAQITGQLFEQKNQQIIPKPDINNVSSLNGIKLLGNIKKNNQQETNFELQITLENLLIKPIFTKALPNYKETLNCSFITPKFSLDVITNNLGQIIINKQEKEIIAVLKAIEPKIINIQIGSNKMIWIDTGLRQLVPINIMGDGIRKFLAILTAIYNAKDGIILIDEIENGLHYSALKDLWKAIFNAANLFNVQIFATTHNIETLKYLNEVLKEDMPEFQNDVRNYTLSKLDNDTTKVYKYDFEEFEHAIEQQIEIRE